MQDVRQPQQQYRRNRLGQLHDDVPNGHGPGLPRLRRARAHARYNFGRLGRQGELLTRSSGLTTRRSPLSTSGERLLHVR